MNNLAPIGLSTYKRINHLKKTVEALKNNKLAKESDLYIFSDAPKKGDEKEVAEVREYLKSINGFKKMHIFEREENNRVYNNREGARYLLDKYGKIIFLEEDQVSHPMFLKYMNDALNFFYNDKKIFAICGYCVPVKFKTKHENNFFLSVYFGLPYATWSDRGRTKVVERKDQYIELKKNKNLKKKIKKTHPQLINALKLMHEGKLDAGDYKINFHMKKFDLYCITPVRSMINNIGYDGSGVHCGKTDRWNVNFDNVEKINFISGYKYDKRMDKEIYMYKRMWISKLPLLCRKTMFIISIILKKLKIK